MQLDKIRRMAADILKVGKNRVWINQDEREKIMESMTKEDIRALIKDGLIKKKRKKELSRARARKLHEKKKKGRKKGPGKRVGSKKARMKEKKKWAKAVRAQRKKLRQLRKKKEKLKLPYGKLYKMIKGDYFRGKKYLETFAKGTKK